MTTNNEYTTIEAEQAVIGSVLRNGSPAWEAVGNLLPEHFWSLEHGAIWRLISNRFLDQNLPFSFKDLDLAANGLVDFEREAYHEAGGASYFDEVIRTAGLLDADSADTLAAFACQVYNAWLERQEAKCRTTTTSDLPQDFAKYAPTLPADEGHCVPNSTLDYLSEIAYACDGAPAEYIFEVAPAIKDRPAVELWILAGMLAERRCPDAAQIIGEMAGANERKIHPVPPMVTEIPPADFPF